MKEAKETYVLLDLRELKDCQKERLLDFYF